MYPLALSPLFPPPSPPPLAQDIHVLACTTSYHFPS